MLLQNTEGVYCAYRVFRDSDLSETLNEIGVRYNAPPPYDPSGVEQQPQLAFFLSLTKVS